MSILYKSKEDIIYTADITQGEDQEVIKIDFYCDGGKHGAIEAVDGYELTAKELLGILQEARGERYE